MKADRNTERKHTHAATTNYGYGRATLSVAARTSGKEKSRERSSIRPRVAPDMSSGPLRSARLIEAKPLPNFGYVGRSCSLANDAAPSSDETSPLQWRSKHPLAASTQKYGAFSQQPACWRLPRPLQARSRKQNLCTITSKVSLHRARGDPDPHFGTCCLAQFGGAQRATAARRQSYTIRA